MIGTNIDTINASTFRLSRSAEQAVENCPCIGWAWSWKYVRRPLIGCDSTWRGLPPPRRSYPQVRGLWYMLHPWWQETRNGSDRRMVPILISIAAPRIVQIFIWIELREPRATDSGPTGALTGFGNDICTRSAGPAPPLVSPPKYCRLQLKTLY